MAALDWIALVVVVSSLLLGAWRGLLYEVASLIGWVLALLGALWGAELVGHWLPMGQASEAARYAAGFVIVFVVVAFAGGAVAAMLRRASAASGLRPVDRMLGAGFGALRGVALLLVLAVLVGLSPWRQADWWAQSVSGRWLELALKEMRPLWPQGFDRYLSA